jgi:UDP-galactose transporter
MIETLRERYHKLFPKKRCAVIFVVYMALFITQGLTVTATQKPDHKYEYNTATVVLLAETAKLVTSVIIFVCQNSWDDFKVEMKQRTHLVGYYFIPAVLYCLYNNLQFTSLSWFDPTSYFVLMQFRVVVTGVLFQFIFKKKLTRIQWLSLILLTMGCTVQRLQENDIGKVSLDVNIYLILILLQVLSSCFAGVYTEFLLKTQGRDTPVMVQNVFLYLDSIFCNLVLLTYNGQVFSFLSYQNLQPVLSFKVIYIIINQTCIGIVVSLFLRYLNSILKSFASALEIVFTAVLAMVLFGVPIGFYTVISICLIFVATFLYSANPVNNTSAKRELGKDDCNSNNCRPRNISSSDKV